MSWCRQLAALLIVLALFGCSEGTTGQAGPPYAPYSGPRTPGQGPSTAEEMVAVAAEVCSWRGVGDCDPGLRPPDPLNARATAGFKVDLG